jgi:hypothetical protein
MTSIAHPVSALVASDTLESLCSVWLIDQVASERTIAVFAF